jgi:hypothetical protein
LGFTQIAEVPNVVAGQRVADSSVDGTHFVPNSPSAIYTAPPGYGIITGEIEYNSFPPGDANASNQVDSPPASSSVAPYTATVKAGDKQYLLNAPFSVDLRGHYSSADEKTINNGGFNDYTFRECNFVVVIPKSAIAKSTVVVSGSGVNSTLNLASNTVVAAPAPAWGSQ